MLSKKILSSLFLSLLLVIVASINLCHTEGSLGKDPYCPACNFQSSCFVLDSAAEILLPELALREIVSSVEALSYAVQVVLGFPVRSPPRV